MYDDLDPEDLKPWQIAVFALVIVVLASIAIYTMHNVVKAVA